jgi:putative transposase
MGQRAMANRHVVRTVQFKLYPSAEQAGALEMWLRRCCWLYNRALDKRIKSYKRRGESVSMYAQMVWLTSLRSRLPWLAEVPAWFARSALHRLDKAFKGFFRRCKAGEKPGFPRFKSADRYRSMEFLEKRPFIREHSVFVPLIGPIHARGEFGAVGEQRTLKIIHRASGWYASVTIRNIIKTPVHPSTDECGIDLGLEAFATLDSGERIENPRTLRRAEKKLKAASRRLSRCKRDSNRRNKAKQRLARLHERVERKRRGFCHRVSRDLANRFAHIAIEDLSIKGLASGMLAKQVNDAAWGLFIFYLTYKAANAGGSVAKVGPCGTSQECPICGSVAHKELSERTHCCPSCGFRCHRDQAAAMVIRQRAFGSVRGDLVRPAAPEQAGSMKREVQATASVQ